MYIGSKAAWSCGLICCSAAVPMLLSAGGGCCAGMACEPETEEGGILMKEQRADVSLPDAKTRPVGSPILGISIRILFFGGLLFGCLLFWGLLFGGLLPKMKTDSLSILGTWSNGKDEWAYRYTVTFFEDGTVIRNGYRNLEKGVYTAEGDEIRVTYTDCQYDFGGYIPIEGYSMVYRYDRETGCLVRMSRRTLPYVETLAQNNFFDNDDPAIPLMKEGSTPVTMDPAAVYPPQPEEGELLTVGDRVSIRYPKLPGSSAPSGSSGENSLSSQLTAYLLTLAEGKEALALDYVITCRKDGLLSFCLWGVQYPGTDSYLDQVCYGITVDLEQNRIVDLSQQIDRTELKAELALGRLTPVSGRQELSRLQTRPLPPEPEAYYLTEDGIGIILSGFPFSEGSYVRLESHSSLLETGS